MINIPNPKSIIEKILEYKLQYITEHSYAPNVIYLDAEEREELCKAYGLTSLDNGANMAGMKLRREEDFVINTDRFKVI